MTVKKIEARLPLLVNGKQTHPYVFHSKVEVEIKSLDTFTQHAQLDFTDNGGFLTELADAIMRTDPMDTKVILEIGYRFEYAAVAEDAPEEAGE